MRGFILSLAVTALLCPGCVQSCRDTTLYQHSGRQKAIVSVLPVINHVASTELPWDLSREFTDEIRKRAYDSSKVYLLRDAGNLQIAEQLNVPNPKHISSSVTNTLGAAEFVIVAEIIEQEEVPYGLAHSNSDNPFKDEIGSVFSSALRVRVFDVRKETPKIVLQEVLDQDYVVARAYMNSDYSKNPWGTEAFTRTPMGIAHSRLVRELVSRAESYIEAAR